LRNLFFSSDIFAVSEFFRLDIDPRAAYFVETGSSFWGNECFSGRPAYMKTINDRILLVLVACATLGIVALADWQLTAHHLADNWRDYVLYNACMWIVISLSLRDRITVAQFRNLFLIVLVFHWLVAAALTRFGVSFLWSGILVLGEVFVLNVFWQRISEKAKNRSR